MSLEQTKPQADIGNGSDTDRQRAVEQLYLKSENYDHIIDTALSDRRLFKDDAEHIAQGVAKYLPEYDGPIQDEAFQEWASDIIRPAVDRMARLYAMLDEYKGYIRGGIRSGLGLATQAPNFFDDDAALVADIFQEVSWLIFLRLDSLLEPGTAALSTRLFGLARKHTVDYHTKKLRRRFKLGKSYPTSIQECEVLSDVELASMAEAEREDED